MSNFEHIETIIGPLHEIKNIENKGEARCIITERMTGTLRPAKISGKILSKS